MQHNPSFDGLADDKVKVGLKVGVARYCDSVGCVILQDALMDMYLSFDKFHSFIESIYRSVDMDRGPLGIEKVRREIVHSNWILTQQSPTLRHCSVD